MKFVVTVHLWSRICRFLYGTRDILSTSQSKALKSHAQILCGAPEAFIHEVLSALLMLAGTPEPPEPAVLRTSKHCRPREAAPTWTPGASSGHRRTAPAAAAAGQPSPEQAPTRPHIGFSGFILYCIDFIPYTILSEIRENADTNKCTTVYRLQTTWLRLMRVCVCVHVQHACKPRVCVCVRVCACSTCLQTE